MNLKYFGDVLSLLRALLVVPVIAFSAAGNWTAAVLVLALAWATDLVDGPAAKKWGGLRDRHPDFDADGIADTVLAFGSTLVPLVYAYANYDMTVVIGLTALYALAAVVGTRMALVMNKPGHRWLIAFNMIVLHSAVQIGGGLVWFAYMANRNPVDAWLVGGIFAIIAILQSKKIALWWNGRFQPVEEKR
jgi:phosphatidylglycerophosphate synthase